jgi:hypothetical protein
MDPSKAKLHFPIQDGDDLQDLYDEQIFNYKQFFLNHAPSTKLFHSKLRKLQLMHDAFIFFGGSDDLECEKWLKLKPYEGNLVQEVYNVFQVNSNEIKLKISKCNNARCLTRFAEIRIKNLHDYASMWVIDIEESVNDVLISKEADEMLMIAAIKLFNAQGFNTFKEATQLDLGNVLRKESIRLSLWLKMESDVTTI